MHLAGEHNALNATAAAALAAGQGISKESIRSALATSKASSAASKFATRSTASPSSKTSRTIPPPSAKRFARSAPSILNRALWAVLEPRSNTLRRKVLEDELVESLRLADRVVLAGVYQQQRIPDAERLHPEDVVTASTPLELQPNCIRTPTRSSTASRRNCTPAMLSPSSPTAASTASMRNFLRASKHARFDRERIP